MEKTHKLKTGEEMFGLYDKVDFLINEAERWKTIVKALLSRNNLIVLHNKDTGEDEILSFNCNLCDKVGNCMTEHLVDAAICPNLEYKDGWEEVG